MNTKLLDMILTGVTVVSVTVVIAYFGLLYDTGLFTVLPESITGFFLQNRFLQWVALVALIGALVGKTVTGRVLKHHRLQQTRT
jgi:Mg2+/citrate symporter